jgi:hypothetical protein
VNTVWNKYFFTPHFDGSERAGEPGKRKILAQTAKNGFHTDRIDSSPGADVRILTIELTF